MNRPQHARKSTMWMLVASLAAAAPALADDRAGSTAANPTPPPWRARYGASLPPSSPLAKGGGTPFGTAMIPTPTPPEQGGWPASPPAQAPAAATAPTPIVNRPFLGGNLPSSPANGVLTPETLVPFLSGLGNAVRADRTPGGAISGMVKVRRGDWAIPVRVSVSEDRRHIRLVAPLRPNLREVGGLPASVLARLLAANDEIGPHHFALAEGGRALHLNVAFENRDLTPAAFQARLESIAKAAVDAEPLWNGPEWAAISDPR